MAFAATEDKYVQLDDRHVPIISRTTMKVTEIIERLSEAQQGNLPALQSQP